MRTLGEALDQLAALDPKPLLNTLGHLDDEEAYLLKQRQEIDAKLARLRAHRIKVQQVIRDLERKKNDLY